MSLINKLGSIFNRRSSKELGSVLGGVDNSLSTVQEDVSLLDLEYNIKTSTGEWLDEWGTWFGVSRSNNETDVAYRNRILLVAVRPKNTIPALIDAIRASINDPDANIWVYEPHTDTFKFNISELSGTDKIQDGVYQRHSVVDIYIDVPLPPNLIDLVTSIKSAGVKIYFTRVNQIGGGTIVRMYTETLPKYHSTLETFLSINQVDIHVIGGRVFGDPNAFVSGRKLMFPNHYLEFELGKVRMARTIAHSSNTALYDYPEVPLDIIDDYFNAVTYEREKELGKVVMLDEVIAKDESFTTTTLQSMVTPDLYANSLTPMNIFLDKTVLELYLHSDDNELESNLDGDAYTQAFAGSMFPISMFLDESIEDIADGITFEQSIYSAGVQSETLPV